MSDDVSRTVAVSRLAVPIIAVVVPIVVIAAAGTQGDIVLQRQIITMLVNLVLVVGLYVFAGNSGVLSFGHVSFVAIGAYTTAVLTIPAIQKGVFLPDLPAFIRDNQVPSLLAMLISGVLAAVVAGIVGFPLMRLNGLAASLALFAFLIVVRVVAQNWNEVTRGTNTMIGVPTETTLWRSCTVAVLVCVVAYLYQSSRRGLLLRASREDEVAARSVGVRITRERWIALVLSAFITGVGGFLYAQYLGSLNPDVFWLNLTFIVIAMLVVGGLTSLAGAVYGTIAVSAVSEALRRIEGGVDIGGFQIPSRGGMREVGLALFMLIVLLVRPAGLTGGREITGLGPLTPRFLRRRHSQTPTPKDRADRAEKAGAG